MVMIWISIEFENDWYEGKIVQTFCNLTQEDSIIPYDLPLWVRFIN